MSDSRNKEKSWDLFLNQCIFPMNCVRLYFKSLRQVSKADEYVVQNLTWSGSSLCSTFSYALLHKVLAQVMMTATRTEVYVVTITTVLYCSYYSLYDILNHLNSLKLKSFLGENFVDCYTEILVDYERLQSTGDLNAKHLGYITCIFEGTFDFIFHIWGTHNYQEVMSFMKKLWVCDNYFMRPDEIITYGSRFQEAIHEYHNIFDSK